MHSADVADRLRLRVNSRLDKNIYARLRLGLACPWWCVYLLNINSVTWLSFIIKLCVSSTDDATRCFYFLDGYEATRLCCEWQPSVSTTFSRQSVLVGLVHTVCYLNLQLSSVLYAWVRCIHAITIMILTFADS